MIFRICSRVHLSWGACAICGLIGAGFGFGRDAIAIRHKAPASGLSKRPNGLRGPERWYSAQAERTSL